MTREDARRYLATAVLMLCGVSFVPVLFGVDYRVAVGANVLSLFVVALDLRGLRAATKRHERRDVLESGGIPKLSQLFMPARDLFYLPYHQNFYIYVLVNCIFYMIYSFFSKEYFIVNIGILVSFIALSFVSLLLDREP